LSFIKYSIISALLVLLYFVWLDKNYFYNSFKTQKEKNTQLTKQIKLLNNKLQQKQEEIQKLIKEKKDLLHIQKKVKNNKKVIKIILPKDDLNYSNIIPNEKYDFIDNKNTIIKDDEDDLKIIPSISLDEENKVDAVKVNIETKF
jgi:hypothetical protein